MGRASPPLNHQPFLQGLFHEESFHSHTMTKGRLEDLYPLFHLFQSLMYSSSILHSPPPVKKVKELKEVASGSSGHSRRVCWVCLLILLNMLGVHEVLCGSARGVAAERMNPPGECQCRHLVLTARQ